LDTAEANPRPPRILAEKIVSAYEANQFRGGLKSTILFEGAFAGMLLVAEYYTDSARLMLIPVEPGGKTVNVAIEYPLSEPGWLTMQEEGQVLFMGLEKVGQSMPKDRFPVLRLSPDGTHTVLYLYNRPTEDHFQDYSAIVGPWIKGNHLVYGNELRSWDSNNGTMYTLNVRTSPLAGEGRAVAESPTATTLYNATIKIDGSLNSQATKRIFGSALFSYIKDDELHAMTYDGKTDVVVEYGVSMLYDLSFRNGQQWLR
ncbi:MAG TPA: hypothetical protein VEX13_17780, partial [Chloroflexia bacterium]|nr:hypothetical protein [Chloroflexia bacterium]